MAILPSRTWQRLAWSAGAVVVVSIVGAVTIALPTVLARLSIAVAGIIAYKVVEGQW